MTTDVAINGNVEYASDGSDPEGFKEKAKLTIPSGYVLEAPEGYEWAAEQDGKQVLKADTSVAKIGDVKYETLAEAVAAVEDNTTATIKLLADADGSGIFLAANEGKNITIDFGGKTYTITSGPVGSTGYETQGLHLEKGNTVTLKNGKLTSSADSGVKMLVQKYCDLTLEDMELDGTKLSGSETHYVLSNNNGITTLTGKTTITAAVGDVAFDVYYWPTAGYQTVSVEILTTDVAISGNVEYASDGGVGWAENASLTIPMDYSLTAPEGFVWVAQDGKEVLTKAEVVRDEAGLLAALADNTITAIVLDENIVLDSTLDIADKTITLDLNGHKLSTPDASGAAAQTVLKITGTSNVTIQGDGLIQSGTTSSYSGWLNTTPTIHIDNDSSSLTIKNSAVIKGGDAINSYDTAPAIWGQNFKNFTITGATIRGGDHIKKSGITIGYNNYSTAGHALELMVASGKTVNITNSTISGGNGINDGYTFTDTEGQLYMLASGGQAFYMNQSNTINITDSIIEGGDSALHHGGHAIAVNSGVFNIINSNIVGGDGNTYWKYSVGRATSGTGTYNIDASSTTADGINSNPQ